MTRKLTNISQLLGNLANKKITFNFDNMNFFEPSYYLLCIHKIFFDILPEFKTNHKCKTKKA